MVRSVYVFKFRPSSHSDDYTVIATYKDRRAAEKVRDALERLLDYARNNEEALDIDWSPDEARVAADGNEVTFRVYTSGYLDDVESVMRTAGSPEDVECYANYQELVVKVRLPQGLTTEAAMLVLDREEADAIKWLNDNCGPPKVTKRGNEDEFEWHYKGNGIYSENDDDLYVGFEFSLESRRNWEVSVDE